MHSSFVYERELLSLNLLRRKPSIDWQSHPGKPCCLWTREVESSFGDILDIVTLTPLRCCMFHVAFDSLILKEVLCHCRSEDCKVSETQDVEVKLNCQT